jgi:hypothetical protein
MMAEKRLFDIIKAADPEDRDDIEIRTLLVAALEESSIQFKVPSSGQASDVTTSCEYRARLRAVPRASPGRRRTRRVFDRRSR